jgi:ubiquitin-like protein Pup
MSEQEFLRTRSMPDEVIEQVTVVPTQPIDISDLLDQIDGVLETNARQFVDNFIQKGGQ